MLGTGIYTVKLLFVTLSRALWRWEHSPGARRSAWHLEEVLRWMIVSVMSKG